jgi:hypothetical protein
MGFWQGWRRPWLLGALAGCSAAAGAAGGNASDAPAAAAPPVQPGPVVAAAALQSDLALLRRAYENLHPGLYRYRSKAEMDAAFDALGREFARDRTLGEAYLGLARLTAYVQCGHTYPNFFNQSPPVVAAVLEAPRLPFEFRWLDRRVVVTRDYSGVPALRRGAEVLSIDGRPVGEILDALLPYSRADGANDAKRVSNLEVQGRGRYEAFDVYFPLRFPRPPGRPFVLELRSEPGATVRTVEVAGMAAAARVVVDGAPRGEANPWELRALEPGVAYLGMPTWALYNSKFDWQAYLDGLFAGLVADGVTDLVIDLRQNEGGSNVGDRLLAHLVATDLPAQPIVRKTRYRKVPADLVPHLDTWDREFYDWGPAAVDLGDGFYRLTRDDDEVGGSVVKALPPRFPGRVWVLVGAVNSSATFEFASAVKRHGLATLVGQPTGGNQRGITGGGFFFLQLPKSGLEVDLPLIGQFPVSAAPLPDAGIEPDLLVVPTIEDVASGRDAELEAVLARIGSQPR